MTMLHEKNLNNKLVAEFLGTTFLLAAVVGSGNNTTVISRKKSHACSNRGSIS